MMTKYFYDTYAIIEFINENERFKDYFLKYEGITTLYNVMEVYYIILRDFGEEKAKEAINLLKPIIIYPTIELVEESMKFRLKHRIRNKKLSYSDCLGYIIALKENAKFLTGDVDFKGLPNVEFVR